MKNHHLLLILSLVLSLTAQAQNFRFGLNVSPALTDNLLSKDGTMLGTVSGPVKNTDEQTFGYYAYFFSQYALTKKWNFQLGIGYSRIHYITGKKSNLVFAEADPGVVVYAPFSWKYEDIIVPVLSRYYFTKRNNFYLIGGLTPQIKLKRIKKQEAGYFFGTPSAEEDHSANTAYRKVNFNGTIGVGYELKIAHTTRLFFQPTFDCNLLDTAKKSPLNRNIYSLGMNVGLVIN